jgi:hypothetical protein
VLADIKGERLLHEGKEEEVVRSDEIFMALDIPAAQRNAALNKRVAAVMRKRGWSAVRPGSAISSGAAMRANGMKKGKCKNRVLCVSSVLRLASA